MDDTNIMNIILELEDCIDEKSAWNMLSKNFPNPSFYHGFDDIMSFILRHLKLDISVYESDNFEDVDVNALKRVYLTCKKYYEDVSVRKDASLGNSKNNENSVILAHSKSDNSLVVSDIESINKDYYASILEGFNYLLNDFTFGKSDLHVGLLRSTNKELKNIYRWKKGGNDQVRIYFKILDNNKFYILGIFIKKSDWDKKVENFLVTRKKNVCGTEKKPLDYGNVLNSIDSEDFSERSLEINDVLDFLMKKLHLKDNVIDVVMDANSDDFSLHFEPEEYDRLISEEGFNVNKPVNLTENSEVSTKPFDRENVTFEESFEMDENDKLKDMFDMKAVDLTSDIPDKISEEDLSEKNTVENPLDVNNDSEIADDEKKDSKKEVKVEPLNVYQFSADGVPNDWYEQYKIYRAKQDTNFAGRQIDLSNFNKWIKNQSDLALKGLLTNRQLSLLSDIGYDFRGISSLNVVENSDSVSTDSESDKIEKIADKEIVENEPLTFNDVPSDWYEQYNDFKVMLANGFTGSALDRFNFDKWINNQKSLAFQGVLSDRQLELLSDIGYDFRDNSFGKPLASEEDFNRSSYSLNTDREILEKNRLISSMPDILEGLSLSDLMDVYNRVFELKVQKLSDGFGEISKRTFDGIPGSDSLDQFDAYLASQIKNENHKKK